MKDKILKLTKQLMAIHTTKDNKKGFDQVLEIIKKELRSDFVIEEFENEGVKSLLIHNAKRGTKKFKVILNGHLDVIAANKKQYTMVEKSGKLYGRGSYDMKAALSVMVVLFKNIAKNLHYPIALQVVTDEEIGGFNGVNYQIKKAIRTDFVIVGDCGSNLNIVDKAKGIMWLKLHAEGVKAHGAYLWRGENALWKIHRALVDLHKIFPVPTKEAWVSTMNLAKIETDNTAFNHVPDGASAYLDFRFIHEDEKSILNKVIKVVAPDIDVEVIFKNSPEYIPHENKYVQLLQKAHTDVLGKKAKFLAAHAPSDLRHFNAVDCMGVGFGPVGGHQHGDGEWVDINSLENYYQILNNFLLRVARD